MPRALRHVCALWAPSQAAHRGAPKASKVRAVRHAVHVLCRLPLVAKRSNATAGGVLPQRGGGAVSINSNEFQQ